MDLSGYYDIGNKRFTAALEDTASVGLPILVAGEDITLRAKFKRTRDGVIDEVRPEVVAMKAMLGQVDARPSTGLIKLTIDGIEFDEAIEFNPTATGASSFETLLKGAIETATSETVTVRKQFDSYFLKFNTEPETLREISVTFNSLFPSSFLHIRSYVRAGHYEYEFRAVKAPVGFSNTFELGEGPVPTFETLLDGGEVEGSKWRELQKLVIPPSFTGTFRIKRGEAFSEVLSRESSLDEIRAAVEPIKDPGGEWQVDFPVSNTFYFYFGGDMEGIDQPEMEAVVFDAPPEEHVISFTTKTRGMAEVMMEVDQAILALEVYALLKDLENPEVERWHCILRQNVGVREAIDWDALSTAPEIDWLNPPTLIKTSVFSPGQVSNGQIHSSGTIGNSALTVFEYVHGLATSFVDVIIMENAEPGAKMREGTHYTWTRDNANKVTVTWLSGVPTDDQYTITVLGLAQTSFFDDHEHVIEEIEGLPEWIATVEARLAALGASSGTGTIRTETDPAGGESARWALPRFWELYPSRLQPTRPESGLLSDVDLNEQDENGVAIINRGRGLLPAVHDATVENIPSPLPAANASFVGKVYLNNTSSTITLGGGYGLRSQRLKPGEFAACDGRIWYVVVPYNRYGGAAFTTNFSASPTLFTYTSATVEQLVAGTAVDLSTTNTLPTGMNGAVKHYVVAPDFATRTFKLALTVGGTPIEVSSNGTGVHSVLIEDSISYYPKHFERTLCTIHVNEMQLRTLKDLYLSFALEAALLKSTVDAQLSVMVEIGEPVSESTTGLEGANLEEIVWRAIPALDQTIVLSPTSSTHKMGMHIYRRLLNSVDTIIAKRMLYGAEYTGAVPPRTGNFSLRVKFGKFDTSNGETDANGLLMLSGMDVTRGTNESKASYELGFAVIK